VSSSKVLFVAKSDISYPQWNNLPNSPLIEVILVWETITSANPLVACPFTMHVKRFSSDILFQF
jgi:hypothetical protein